MCVPFLARGHRSAPSALALPAVWRAVGCRRARFSEIFCLLGLLARDNLFVRNFKAFCMGNGLVYDRADGTDIPESSLRFGRSFSDLLRTVVPGGTKS